MNLQIGCHTKILKEKNIKFIYHVAKGELVLAVLAHDGPHGHGGRGQDQPDLHLN